MRASSGTDDVRVVASRQKTTSGERCQMITRGVAGLCVALPDDAQRRAVDADLRTARGCASDAGGLAAARSPWPDRE